MLNDLQLVRLHRRRHDARLREGNRHQGPLRQLRQQRDRARQAGGGQDGLRRRRALVATGPSCRPTAACCARSTRPSCPNFKNLDPDVQAQLAKLDPGNQYMVNWLWGYTTVGINVDKVKAALGSTPMPDNAWDLVFKPEYISKLKSCGVSFLDSATEVMPGRAALPRQAGLPQEPGRLRRRRAAAQDHPPATSRCSARRATSTTWPTARSASRWAGRATSTSLASAPSTARPARRSRPCCPRPAACCSST